MTQQATRQDQVQILNKIYVALGTLKIDGTQAELLSEIRKGVALVNNALVAEMDSVEPKPSSNGVEAQTAS